MSLSLILLESLRKFKVVKMNILFIGDIIGKPGRHAVHNCLARVKTDYSIDFILANGENAAGGTGIQPDIFKNLMEMGIDVLTSGNHIWAKKEVREILGKDARLLRPHNYPSENPGTGLGIFDCKGVPVAVLNLMGRTFVNIPLDCPFKTADRALSEIQGKAKVILVDMHCEATSEKRALGWYLDGRVSAAIGTHTHIMTADEEILPGGTAYLTVCYRHARPLRGIRGASLPIPSGGGFRGQGNRQGHQDRAHSPVRELNSIQLFFRAFLESAL
jgi:metallophosphoesterase (TIGR00282 family)